MPQKAIDGPGKAKQSKLNDAKLSNMDLSASTSYLASLYHQFVQVICVYPFILYCYKLYGGTNLAICVRLLFPSVTFFLELVSFRNFFGFILLSIFLKCVFFKLLLFYIFFSSLDLFLFILFLSFLSLFVFKKCFCSICISLFLIFNSFLNCFCFSCFPFLLFSF